MGWYLIVATIPIGILGYVFQDQIENGGRDLWLIGTTLIVFGLILGYADHVGRHERDVEQLSSATECGRAGAVARADPRRVAVGRDHERRPAARPETPAAARFSFLLAIPPWLRAGCSSSRA